MRTILYRARNLPPAPTSIGMFQIPQPLMLTERGSLFVQSIDRNSGMVILSSDEQLLQFARCRTLFMDGTFKTCPNLWSQLYLIKGQVRHGQNLLIAAVLLTSKTQDTYITMFRKIKSLIMEKHGEALRTEMIMSDYETGLIPAIRQEIPAARHQGCYFHYTQAVQRYIKSNLQS